MIVGISTENDIARWEFCRREGERGGGGIGWRNEKDFCQDYPIFLWLSTKHGAVSGGGGCNCGALGFCLPPRGSVHTWKWNVPCVRGWVCVCVLPPLRAVAFGALIEIISMRIEPSQPARVLRDYYCATAWLVHQHLPSWAFEWQRIPATSKSE